MKFDISVAAGGDGEQAGGGGGGGAGASLGGIGIPGPGLVEQERDPVGLECLVLTKEERGDCDAEFNI